MPIAMKNEELAVTLHSPEDAAFSARFDQAFAAKQVVLHGRYEFCEPEQLLPDRRSGGGIGLCGEFVWDELGTEAKKGEQFVKPGVGLLTQVADYQPYDMWAPYAVQPFATQISQQTPDHVVLVQEMTSPAGLAMRLMREVVLWKNTLTLHTHLENTGTRAIQMAEYQHNFVSVNHAPMAKGYRLTVPCNRAVDDIPNCCRAQGNPVPGVLHTEDDSLCWDDDMAQKVLFRVVEQPDIGDMGRYSWTLSHADSPAQVQEIAYFRPSLLRLWGIEHCVSTEFFFPIALQPGEKCAFARTWVFSD